MKLNASSWYFLFPTNCRKPDSFPLFMKKKKFRQKRSNILTKFEITPKRPILVRKCGKPCRYKIE